MMKNETTKKIIFIAIAVIVAAVLSFVPKENELLSRSGWQFIGLFAAMLIVIITGAVQDWAAGLIVCVFLVLFNIDTFPSLQARRYGHLLLFMHYVPDLQTVGFYKGFH